MESNFLFKSSKTDLDNFDNPDIVLLQLPCWGIETPPMAMAKLSGFLRDKGYKVLPLDLNIELYIRRTEKYDDIWNIEISPQFWSKPHLIEEYIEDNKKLLQQFVDEIVNSGTKLVGFTIYTTSRTISFYLAQQIKERNPEIKIVFGGPDALRDMSGKYIVEQSSVDVAVQGEGEMVLLDIVGRVISGQNIYDCPGTLTFRNNEHIDNKNVPLLKKLDDLPFADFSDFSFSNYTQSHRLPVESCRGCPNQCIYCSEKAYWITYRLFSAERIFAEIKHQFEKNPHLTYVDFHDSLVNGNIKQLYRLAELIIESGLKFQWAGQAVVRKEMRYDLFKKLADSGCICLAFGLETTSQSLMGVIGKHLAKDTDVNTMVQEAHSAGLSCAYNFMFGLPGEKPEDAENSLEFLRKNKDAIGTVNPTASFCAFTPGTPGGDRPDDFDISEEIAGGGQYWETKDGSNTFLIRLKRFEDFCALVMKLGIRTTYPSATLMGRDYIIANYYFWQKNYKEAAVYYQKWVDEHPADERSVNRLEKCRNKCKKRFQEYSWLKRQTIRFKERYL